MFILLNVPEKGFFAVSGKKIYFGNITLIYHHQK